MKRILFATLILFALSGCSNNTPVNSNIPYASVSFAIDVAVSGADNELREGMLGNSKIYTTTHPATLSTSFGRYGYSGVVVVRAYDDRLYAFDICCTNEVDRNIALESDGFFLKCPKCGSTFEIGNGYGIVNQGPAIQPLKNYKVTGYSGDRYRVSN